MQLKEYLDMIKKENGTSFSWFCKKCGIARPTLRRILKGYHFGTTTAFKIIDATEGKVSYDELSQIAKRNENTHKN